MIPTGSHHRFACTAEDGSACYCPEPFPKNLVVGTPPRRPVNPLVANTTPCRCRAARVLEAAV